MMRVAKTLMQDGQGIFDREKKDFVILETVGQQILLHMLVSILPFTFRPFLSKVYKDMAKG